MRKLITTALLAAALLLGGCASLDSREAYQIDAVAQAATIQILVPDGRPVASGVIISSDTFLTAAHVARAMPYLPWISIGFPEYLDYAIGTRAEDNIQPAALNCSWRPELGAKLYALTFPANMGLTFSQGYVNTLQVADTYLFGADLVVGSGSSGGPVFDTDWRLVGIVTSSVSQIYEGSMGTDVAQLKAAGILPIYLLEEICPPDEDDIVPVGIRG